MTDSLKQKQKITDVINYLKNGKCLEYIDEDINDIMTEYTSLPSMVMCDNAQDYQNTWVKSNAQLLFCGLWIAYKEILIKYKNVKRNYFEKADKLEKEINAVKKRNRYLSSSNTKLTKTNNEKVNENRASLRNEADKRRTAELALHLTLMDFKKGRLPNNLTVKEMQRMYLEKAKREYVPRQSKSFQE